MSDGPLIGTNTFKETTLLLSQINTNFWYREKSKDGIEYGFSDRAQGDKVKSMYKLSDEIIKHRIDTMAKVANLPEEHEDCTCIILNDSFLEGNGNVIYFKKNGLLVGTKGKDSHFHSLDEDYHRFERALLRFTQ